MSLDEKIGQLFLISAYIEPQCALAEQAEFDISSSIKNYHVGGLVFVGESEIFKQIELTKNYQQISKYPLLIAQDLEWGLNMRLRDGLRFPKNATLGFVDDDRLIFEMGKEIAIQARRIGVHMNLSPVLDVITEKENLSINIRSFGSSPEIVAKKGEAMIKGLQEGGILTSAKHFPGLGDVKQDPHLTFPALYHDLNRLKKIELYPFIQAIRAGVDSIQTEHFWLAALDPEKQIPASLSYNVVTNLLKKELQFNGLVISGALRMNALISQYDQEEIVLNAFLAGSDILLMPKNLPLAFYTIKKAVLSGQILESEINERVLKILKIKEKLNLFEDKKVLEPTKEELHSASSLELKSQLYKKALFPRISTPVVLDPRYLAYLQVGSKPSFFLKKLESVLDFKNRFFFENEPFALAEKLKDFSLIILASYTRDPREITQIRLLNDQNQIKALAGFKCHGVEAKTLELLKALQPYEKKIVIVHFGSFLGISFFEKFSHLLLAHEDEEQAQLEAALFIIGLFK